MESKKHKVVFFLLALVISLSIVISALAEPILSLGGCDNNSEEYRIFSQAHRDITINSESNIYLSTDEIISAFLTGEMRFDTFVMISRSFDVKKLMQKGYCSNLSDSIFIEEELNKMYMPILDMVSYNGKIFGSPFYCFVGYYGYHPESWEIAGLTESDVPTSFDGLLNFLESWIERIKEEPEENISISNAFDSEQYGPQSYTSYLIDLLMDNYIMQQNYAKEPLRFNTPAFKQMVERCQRIGTDLYTYEPEVKGDYALFDELQGMRDLAYLVPLRMTIDQPILIKASLYMGFINVRSTYQSLAREYLEDCIKCIEPEIGAYLYQNAEPVEDPEYAKSMDLLLDEIDSLKQKLSNDSVEDLSEQRFIQEQIDEKTRKWEALAASEDRYLISPNDLKLYRMYGENLYFQTPSIFDPSTEDGQNVKQLRDRFSSGGLSVDQFVSRLDELAWMLEMEAGE